MINIYWFAIVGGHLRCEVKMPERYTLGDVWDLADFFAKEWGVDPRQVMYGWVSLAVDEEEDVEPASCRVEPHPVQVMVDLR